MIFSNCNPMWSAYLSFSPPTQVIIVIIIITGEVTCNLNHNFQVLVSQSDGWNHQFIGLLRNRANTNMKTVRPHRSWWNGNNIPKHCLLYGCVGVSPTDWHRCASCRCVQICRIQTDGELTQLVCPLHLSRCRFAFPLLVLAAVMDPLWDGGIATTAADPWQPLVFLPK